MDQKLLTQFVHRFPFSDLHIARDYRRPFEYNKLIHNEIVRVALRETRRVRKGLQCAVVPYPMPGNNNNTAPFPPANQSRGYVTMTTASAYLINYAFICVLLNAFSYVFDEVLYINCTYIIIYIYAHSYIGFTFNILIEYRISDETLQLCQNKNRILFS